MIGATKLGAWSNLEAAEQEKSKIDESHESELQHSSCGAKKKNTLQIII